MIQVWMGIPFMFQIKYEALCRMFSRMKEDLNTKYTNFIIFILQVTHRFNKVIRNFISCSRWSIRPYWYSKKLHSEYYFMTKWGAALQQVKFIFLISLVMWNHITCELFLIILPCIRSKILVKLKRFQ